uniref:Uncharacterized protein n=1 Tax=Oryza rufipogon TaxID=4529 RepID=A0A0E0PFN1_ORYRU
MAATVAEALAVTDELALPLRAVGDLAAAAGVSREEVVVITQCASLGGKLPFDDASVGSVLAVIKKVENLGDLFITEISRVLKAGGMVLIQSSPSDQDPNNSIQRKLLLGGFVDVQASAASSQDSEHSVTIKAKKVSWSLGSSFPLKKATKGLPKIQIDDDSELIDEDSLLTEDDLKKPELPLGIVRWEPQGRHARTVLVAGLRLRRSVGWAMHFDVVLAHTEVYQHSSRARRLPYLATSLRLTCDDRREHRQQQQIGIGFFNLFVR